MKRLTTLSLSERIYLNQQYLCADSFVSLTARSPGEKYLVPIVRKPVNTWLELQTVAPFGSVVIYVRACVLFCSMGECSLFCTIAYA